MIWHKAESRPTYFSWHVPQPQPNPSLILVLWLIERLVCCSIGGFSLNEMWLK